MGKSEWRLRRSRLSDVWPKINADYCLPYISYDRRQVTYSCHTEITAVEFCQYD